MSLIICVCAGFEWSIPTAAQSLPKKNLRVQSSEQVVVKDVVEFLPVKAEFCLLVALFLAFV